MGVIHVMKKQWENPDFGSKLSSNGGRRHHNAWQCMVVLSPGTYNCMEEIGIGLC
jgi:hypothetical protein